jgi:ATP-dependent helicase/nuclease subunit A
MTAVVDSPARQRAIDPLASFCVSAPAGSGKTELLIQRYLALLARVERPEQILAITFTRKAAAEMRERVLQALRDAVAQVPVESEHQKLTRNLAEEAIAADARNNWSLLRDVSRLNIKTIDSFCLSLARQMPVLSQIGGQPKPQNDPEPLYAEAVQELFHMLGKQNAVAADLKALMAHFDNNWTNLHDLLVGMLRKRDQWQMYIGVHHQPDDSERYLVDAVQTLVAEELAVLSQVLGPYQAELLELMQFSLGQLGEPRPDEFPTTQSADLPVWRALQNMLQTKKGEWRKSVNKTIGFPTDKEEEPVRRKQQIVDVLVELAQVPELEAQVASVKLLPDTTAGERSWELVLHLSRLLPVLAAQLLLVFRRHGVLDYSQINQSALYALGDADAPTDLALRLDYRIEHILVDEFQDTAINQYELVSRLTHGWGEHNEANPDAPRTLMIVGDAMQSIYGFRNANVGLFLKAREDGFNNIVPEHLNLECNFRSNADVVSWVNNAFARAFPGENDIASSQVKYSPAVSVRPAGEGVAVTAKGFCGDNSKAAEVEYICGEIQQALAAGETGIAVLGRQRSHLQPIGRRLQAMGIAFHAQDLQSLAAAPAVSDLMTICRALASDADRLSWLALLRAPWCGLGLDDLLCVARFGEDSPYQPIRNVLADVGQLAQLSAQGKARITHLQRVLDWAFAVRGRLSLRVWIETIWQSLGGPEGVHDPLDLEDAEHFFQILEDAESEGVGLDANWLELKLKSQFASGGDHSLPVHLMTLHKAKGLEFDTVFIPRLDGTPRSDSRDILLWDEHNSATGDRAFLLAADDGSDKEASTLYNFLRHRRKQKAFLEKTRLLYVGVTRAVKRLHLSASVKWDDKNDRAKAAPPASLLESIWPTFSEAMTVEFDTALQVQEEVEPVPLYRVPLDSLPAAYPEYSTGRPAENVPESPDNHLDRCLGTVVHLAMEVLSQGDSLPASASEQDQKYWRFSLMELGLWGNELEEAVDRVAASVEKTLADEKTGRWILSSSHRDARSEWELMHRHGDDSRKLIIDRSFVDEATGERWIIDYKNSAPLPEETVEEFALRESGHYREQLGAYRDAVKELSNEPIQCGLYFTSLGYLHVVAELYTPAG